MNKRDLIKALFKDPTIKALYESGHFNPTDINRAILTEAGSSVMDMSNEIDPINAAGKSGSQQKKNTSDTSTNKEQKYPTANIESNLEQFNQLVRNHKPKFDLSYLRKYRDLLIKVNTEDFQDENFLTYLTKISAEGNIPQGVISAFQKNNMPKALLNKTPWEEVYQDHMKYIKEYQLAKAFLDWVIQEFESLNWDEEQERVIDRIIKEVENQPEHGRRSTMWASNLFFGKFRESLQYNAYVFLYDVHVKENKDMGTHTFFSEFDALFQKAVEYNEGGGPFITDLFDMSEKFDDLNIEDQTFIDFSTPGKEGVRDTVERFRKAIAVKIIINNLNAGDIKSVSEELITGALGESRGQKKFTNWYVENVLAEDFVNGLKNLIQSNSKDSSTHQDGEEESGSADTDSEIPENLKDYMQVYESLIGDSLDEAIGTESLYSKSFVIYFLQQKIEKEETLEQDDKVKYYATAKEFYEKVGFQEKAEAFAQQMEDVDKKNAIIDFLKTQDSIGKLKNMISPESGTEEVTVDNTDAIAKLNEFLEDKGEIKTALEKYPEFKKLLAVAYVKALSEKSTDEDEEQSTTPTTDTLSVDTGEEEQATATQESINRALRGIFLMENEASTEASVESGSTNTDSNTGSNGEGGGQISVEDAGEVKKMLQDLKTVFTAAKLKIDVKSIWDLSQKKESEPEKEVDPNEDVSPPDLAEFQEKWTEELQTFFGKNPKKSSFMRRLLLRSQAEMLYKVLATLEEIADPAKMAALTDMNQDDEKENQAEEEVKSQLQEILGGSTALRIPRQSEDSSEEEIADPVSILKTREPWVDFVNRGPAPLSPGDAGYVDPEEKQDKVELPAENKRIIKQDLQSMVDLLRQVKKAISSYSKYSTQKSVDPRFDGSKLKANMDDLLTQVQDDIYDLYSNLKPAAPKATPKPEDNNSGDLEDFNDIPVEPGSNIEEALNGIMLEEADPERQEQIKFVREVYDKAKEEYIYSLATSMEGGKWSESQQSAKDILKILKDDKFISLFPTGMKTASGRVMTVGKAYEVMKEMIQDFIETVRDIVLISKTKYISTPSLTQARNNLLQISTKIADLFQVASKFPAKEIKKAKEAEAANPTNQALTGEASEKLEQGSEDNGPTAEVTTDDAADGEGEGGGQKDTLEEKIRKAENAFGEKMNVDLGTSATDTQKANMLFAEMINEKEGSLGSMYKEEDPNFQGPLRFAFDLLKATRSIPDLDLGSRVKEDVGDSETYMSAYNQITKNSNGFQDDFGPTIANLNTKYNISIKGFNTDPPLGLSGFTRERNDELYGNDGPKKYVKLFAKYFKKIIKILDGTIGSEDESTMSLEESLKPIIEKMLKEHYNH